MGRYFGTDGIRGIANKELTPELAYRVGRAAGHLLRKGEGAPQIVVGRDPRISGTLLECALVAGFLSVGAEVVRLGVFTTPGVAYMTRALGADAGAVISASHNPMEDNGIKFFGPDGFKLSDAVEDAIEAHLEGEDRLPRPIGAGIGRLVDYPEGVQKYLAFLKQTAPVDLSGRKIVLDCANGAASPVAERLFVDLGAEVVSICCRPDGTNINAGCGSTKPEKLAEAVVREGADLGLAFDGDADRLIAVDSRGEIVDGDRILGILAEDLQARGALPQNTLVGTVMTNEGLVQHLAAKDIRVERVAVGDRYILERMRERGYALGGEPSGHIILLARHTTGDGLLTALALLQVLQARKAALRDLAFTWPAYPNILVNVRVASKEGWDTREGIRAAIAEAQETLAGKGRIVVRPSGTEPLLRVMVEAEERSLAEALARRIAEAIAREMGGSLVE
ncbi:MAG: Phosphoglucosamine mutase [Brockia lithotrophica]|uniref:Phosphoglucosamine mutase n=1 Tax=Brockia lithotrophica TaxID=933949 RepID=A0A2T5G4T7_9BACL|nr:phosphoglucosamine mutase [Brockia lithotrophica]PTQ51194.1 MAG: Phosphoglucosamine mutase [Brockia lithotrophica]